MKFRRIKRFISRHLSRSHNTIYSSEDCCCSIAKEATAKNMFVKINGESSLIIDEASRINNVQFYIGEKSSVHIGPSVCLENTTIYVNKQSSLEVSNGSSISGFEFLLDNGVVEISSNNVLSKGANTSSPRVCVETGQLKLGCNNNLKCTFWIRFGGLVTIGDYNCINEGTEIRCDERITIGSFNMISYCCDIWDTNTHEIYSLNEKKELFPKDYPIIGKVHHKPSTKPIVINDGSWIGKYSCILKGSVLENNVVLGIHAVVSNETIKTGSKVVPPKSRVMI